MKNHSIKKNIKLRSLAFPTVVLIVFIVSYSLFSLFNYGQGPLGIFSSSAEINVIRGGGKGTSRSVLTQDISAPAKTAITPTSSQAQRKSEKVVTTSQKTTPIIPTTTKTITTPPPAGGVLDNYRYNLAQAAGGAIPTNLLTRGDTKQERERIQAEAQVTLAHMSELNPGDENLKTLANSANRSENIKNLEKARAAAEVKVTNDDKLIAAAEKAILGKNDLSSGPACEGRSAGVGIGGGQWAQTGGGVEGTSIRYCVQCGGERSDGRSGPGIWGDKQETCGEGAAANYITRPDEVIEDETKMAACWSNGAWYADSIGIVDGNRCFDGSWKDPAMYSESMKNRCGDVGYNDNTGFCNERDFISTYIPPEDANTQSHEIVATGRANAGFQKPVTTTDTPWYQFASAPDSDQNIKEGIGTVGGAMAGFVGSTLPCLPAFGGGIVGYAACRAAATIGGAYVANKAIDYTNPTTLGSQLNLSSDPANIPVGARTAAQTSVPVLSPESPTGQLPSQRDTAPSTTANTPETQSQAPSIPQIAVFMQGSSSKSINIHGIKTVCIGQDGKKQECDTSMRLNGCGPSDLINILKILNKTDNLSDAELLDKTLYEDNFYIACSSHGCASGSDSVLAVLQNKYGHEGVLDNMTENMITDTDTLQSQPGTRVYTYTGEVVDPNTNVGRTIYHNAAFVVDNGDVTVYDSYIGSGAPIPCEASGANSLQCGSATYTVAPASDTLSGNPAAFYPAAELGQ